MNSEDVNEDIEEEIHRVSEYFGVLDNALRLKILFYLDNKKDNVTSIADALNRDQSKISKHLKDLRLTDIVEAKSQGRERYYWIKKDEIVELCKKFRNHLSRENDL